jgi:CRP-like cAMP-binding protein
MCASAHRPDSLLYQASSRLLAALPEREYSQVAAHLHEVDLAPGTAVLHRDEPSDDVWLPDSGVVSLVTSLTDGKTVETAIVGAEGLVGIHAVIDAPVALHDAIVDVGGRAHRIAVAAFRDQMQQNERLRHLVLRYLHALLVQLSQAAACNRVHSLRQRACRWLLAIHDRTRTTELPVTQELLAMRLGVRRAGVCEVMRDLREAGAIEHRPGVIVVRSRQTLELGTCECYLIERAHFDAVFD